LIRETVAKNDVMPETEEERAAGVRPDMRGVLPAGTTLRGYELKAILGQGGFGITYRARDTTLGRDVAVKEYLPAMLAVREGRTTVMPRSADHAEQFAWGRERFLEEARTLARFDGTPGIVRVIHSLEATGTAYIVMALIEGETLTKRLLREQRLTPEAIERLLFPLLDGLEEIHATGYLHRDIKPANIMVDARGRPTLIDFGASRAAMAEHSSTLTAIFTPGYAAAEQFSSATLGPWTDIYGLGATLYHAITGRTPPSAIDRILQDTCQKLIELKPEGFAPALLAGIDAALAVRVADRPQNVAEWRHVLRSGEALASSQEATRVARKPGALARTAIRSRRVGVTLRGPALWGAAAAAILVLAGGGWLAFQAGAPGGTGTSTLALSTEQLEQVLAERRKADALAAEKRQLEDTARRKAEAEAETKRQTEAELEQARQARQKAEDDLARLKAEIAAQRQAEQGQREQDQRAQGEAALRRAAEEAAQRKAEAEAEGLRLAEEEARRKAEADAVAKRQADEALARAEAERQRAEQEARQKAEAEAAALRRASEETQRKAMEAETRRKAEEAEAKAKTEREKAEAEAKARVEADKAAAALAKQKEEAEAAERVLRLEAPDRERLQVALTSLGFDTRGSDGILGPRTRDMIAAWQKARNRPPTGYLDAGQRQALLNEATAAVAKYDEQKKAEDEAKAQTPGALPSSSPPSAAQPASAAYDGVYVGDGRLMGGRPSLAASLKVMDGRGSGTLTLPGCDPGRFSVTVSPTGNVSGEGYLNCVLGTSEVTTGPLKISGRVQGKSLLLAFQAERTRFRMALEPGGASPASASPLASPDGLWRGSYSCNAVAAAVPAFSLDLELQLTNGSGTWRNRFAAMGTSGGTFDIHVSIDQDAVNVTRSFVDNLRTTVSGRATLRGHYSGNSIRATGREENSVRECNLSLTRV